MGKGAMDAAQRTRAQWRRWWAFGLVAVGTVVAGLAGLFVPDQPKGHWSGHVASGLIAAGQLVALLLGVVLVWRRLRLLLLVPLAVAAIGLVLEVAGNLQVAASIWRTPYGDQQVAVIGPTFAGFDTGHALASKGDLLVVVGGIAFAVILGITRRVGEGAAVAGVVLSVIPPPWILPGCGAVFLLAYLFSGRSRRVAPAAVDPAAP
jgi:hypothetical protein